MIACSSPSSIPTQFDAIERMPVRTVLVHGQRIAYLDVGAGPPVILIHGFGGSMWQWEYQQHQLSQHFRVLTLDMIGSGLSAKPDIAYTPHELVDFLREFMDVLEIKQASLVGNSLGAGIAIGLALDHPQLVDRLVLISGFPDRVEERLASPLFKRALKTNAPVWLAWIGNWLFGRSLTETVLEEIVYDKTLLTPAVVERSYQNRKRGGYIAPQMAVVKNLPAWENGYAKRLGEIRQQTLIIWGTEDRVFPPTVADDLVRQIPTATLHKISDTGHIPQWEQPTLANHIITEFLTREATSQGEENMPLMNSLACSTRTGAIIDPITLETTVEKAILGVGHSGSSFASVWKSEMAFKFD